MIKYINDKIYNRFFFELNKKLKKELKDNMYINYNNGICRS